MGTEVCMEMDLQEIDYFKIIALFKIFKGRSLQINVVGAISIPFWIECFDYTDYEEEIAFGDSKKTEDDWFYIDKDGMDVWHQYDNFESTDNVIFKIEFDIFTTWIHILCPLEGIEKSA